MTIYEITGQLLELLQMAEDDDVDPKTLSDTFEAVSGEFEEKADGYAKIMRQLTADAAALKAEEERISSRRKTIEANAKRLKDALEEAMRACGKAKFKTAMFGFSIRKNAPALAIVDEKAIPERFWAPQEPKLNRIELLKYVKEHPEECAAYAEAHQSESLVIK